MATSLHQLFGQISARLAEHDTTPIMTGGPEALGHAGRALWRMADFGLNTSIHETQVNQLSQASLAAQRRLWPASGSDLADLMGAASDIAGRAAIDLGRSQRWTIAVEFAASADRCAAQLQRLTPTWSPELHLVRAHAATVERAAWADPPSREAAAVLDRLVPISRLRPGMTGTQTAGEAAAALVAAIKRADQRGGLSLREVRSVIAAAELGSRYIAGVAAALPEANSAAPWKAAGGAWEVVGRASTIFDDLRWTPRAAASEVISWAARIPHALEQSLGPLSELGAGFWQARRDLPHVLTHLQQVAYQLPIVATELSSTVGGWARDGSLYADARRLPQVEEMPLDRVADVIAGRRVKAHPADLDIIISSIDRAGSLSTMLAAELSRAPAAGPPSQSHLAGLYAGQVTQPDAAVQLLQAAQLTEAALAASRTPCHVATTSTPGASSPAHRTR